MSRIWEPAAWAAIRKWTDNSAYGDFHDATVKVGYLRFLLIDFERKLKRERHRAVVAETRLIHRNHIA